MSKQIDVLVIGGGAAGMFAAITAAQMGHQVTLLEPNERLGKKLGITGKGRCNVTNHCEPEEVLKNVPRNSRFLMSALHRFTPEDTMFFFESRGCALKTERGNRVFPVTDRSFDIIDTLRFELRDLGVQILHMPALEILTEDGAVCGVRTERGVLSARAVILCTGGCSYPATGSTGDGYRMAEKLGHTVMPLHGSLVPLEEQGCICARMQGLSLRNVSVSLKDGKGKKVYTDFGELLFTHFGLSGPTILSASTRVEAGKTYTVAIDLKPALDEQKLDARLLRDFQANQNRNVANVLGALLPAKMIPVMMDVCGFEPELKVNTMTKTQRRTLLEHIKNFEIPIHGCRPIEEAIITAGGIKVSEIDPKTMQSKLVPGLYFAGEIIDCDAYTGGFNLQIAWSTAYAAGTAVLQE